MSKVWFVTGGSGGLGACGLIFCGLAVLTIALKAATYGSHGKPPRGVASIRPRRL
jgi:hypothetical protein